MDSRQELPDPEPTFNIPNSTKKPRCLPTPDLNKKSENLQKQKAKDNTLSKYQRSCAKSDAKALAMFNKRKVEADESVIESSGNRDMKNLNLRLSNYEQHQQQFGVHTNSEDKEKEMKMQNSKNYENGQAVTQNTLSNKNNNNTVKANSIHVSEHSSTKSVKVQEISQSKEDLLDSMMNEIYWKVFLGGFIGRKKSEIPNYDKTSKNLAFF